MNIRNGVLATVGAVIIVMVVLIEMQFGIFRSLFNLGFGGFQLATPSPIP